MSGLPSILQHLSKPGDAGQAERVRNSTLLFYVDLLHAKNPTSHASGSVKPIQPLTCSQENSLCPYNAELDTFRVRPSATAVVFKSYMCCCHPDLLHMIQVDRWLEYATYIVGGGALEPACRLHLSAASPFNRLTYMSPIRAVLAPY